MFKPNYEIEGPEVSQVTLRTSDLVLYLLGAFLACMGVVVLDLGLLAQNGIAAPGCWTRP